MKVNCNDKMFCVRKYKRNVQNYKINMDFIRFLGEN